MSRQVREEEALIHAFCGGGGQNPKARRAVWVRSISAKHREQGEFHNPLQELHLCDPDSHFTHLRMSKEHFDDLLTKGDMMYYYYI